MLIMPIALQMAHESPVHASMIAAASIGAVISGSVAGAQLVPYSDTSIMTSAACGLQPVYHVKTQAIQIITAWVSAFSGFILFGFGLPWWLAVCIVFGVMSAVHWFFAGESVYPIKH